MRALGLAIAIGISTLSSRAAASEPDDSLTPGATAFAAGAGTALAPFFIGTSMIVLSDVRPVRNGGVFVVQSGLTLAPFVAHAVVGETKRGLYWSILPAIGEAGMGAIMSGYPDILSYAPNIVRYGYALALSASLFGGALGVIDAVRVGDRTDAAARTSAASRLRIAPLVARGLSGLSIGGEL